MTDFRASLAPLFAPSPQMVNVLAPRNGIVFKQPMFPWVKGGMFAELAAEDGAVLITEEGRPILAQGVLPSA